MFQHSLKPKEALPATENTFLVNYVKILKNAWKIYSETVNVFLCTKKLTHNGLNFDFCKVIGQISSEQQGGLLILASTEAINQNGSESLDIQKKVTNIS